MPGFADPKPGAASHCSCNWLTAGALPYELDAKIRPGDQAACAECCHHLSKWRQSDQSCFTPTQAGHCSMFDVQHCMFIDGHLGRSQPLSEINPRQKGSGGFDGPVVAGNFACGTEQAELGKGSGDCVVEMVVHRICQSVGSRVIPACRASSAAARRCHTPPAEPAWTRPERSVLAGGSGSGGNGRPGRMKSFLL